MNLQEFSNPHQLERYSFLWSEVRLVIAAVALFMGGVPPILALNPFSFLVGLLGMILTLSWIISGAASGYLLYRWLEKKVLFGESDPKDTIAFFVSVVSGINLGLTGLTSQNIGMSIASSYLIFLLVGAMYLLVAAYLYKRWKASGERMF